MILDWDEGDTRVISLDWLPRQQTQTVWQFLLIGLSILIAIISFFTGGLALAVLALVAAVAQLVLAVLVNNVEDRTDLTREAKKQLSNICSFVMSLVGLLHLGLSSVSNQVAQKVAASETCQAEPAFPGFKISKSGVNTYTDTSIPDSSQEMIKKIDVPRGGENSFPKPCAARPYCQVAEWLTKLANYMRMLQAALASPFLMQAFSRLTSSDQFLQQGAVRSVRSISNLEFQ